MTFYLFVASPSTACTLLPEKCPQKLRITLNQVFLGPYLDVKRCLGGRNRIYIKNGSGVSPKPRGKSGKTSVTDKDGKSSYNIPEYMLSLSPQHALATYPNEVRNTSDLEADKFIELRVPSSAGSGRVSRCKLHPGSQRRADQGFGWLAGLDDEVCEEQERLCQNTGKTRQPCREEKPCHEGVRRLQGPL